MESALTGTHVTQLRSINEFGGLIIVTLGKGFKIRRKYKCYSRADEPGIVSACRKSMEKHDTAMQQR